MGRDNDTNETNNEKIFNKGNNLKKGLVIKKSSVKGLGTIYYYFGHSASSENVGERGLSHMAEHLLCHSFDHLLPKLTASSISYNAFTSDNHVVFYWTGLDEKLTELESEFIKIFDFVPTKEQFENERNIILQEYTQYMADQNAIYQNINRKYYDYYGPIGCRTDIESITYEDFLKFYARFKHPTIIYRVTNNKKSEVKEIYKNVVFKNPIKLGKLKKSELLIEASSTFPDSVKLCDWFDVSEFKKYELDFLGSMYSSGLESPLYQEIREKRGLVYGLGLYSDEFRNVITAMFVAMCSPNNVEQVRTLAKEVMTNPEKYLTRERFEIIKSYIVTSEKIKLLQNHGTGSITNDIVYGEEYFENISNVTFERIMEVANLFKKKIETEMKLASFGEKLEI